MADNETSPYTPTVWDGRRIALSVLAIVILLVLWEKAPALGGPLIFAAVFVLIMHGIRAGNIRLSGLSNV